MSEIIWDLALIQKYNQSGPRYTSYPTALEFNEQYTKGLYCRSTTLSNTSVVIICSHSVLPQTLLFLRL